MRATCQSRRLQCQFVSGNEHGGRRRGLRIMRRRGAWRRLRIFNSRLVREGSGRGRAVLSGNAEPSVRRAKYINVYTDPPPLTKNAAAGPGSVFNRRQHMRSG